MTETDISSKTVKRGEAKKADYILYYKTNFSLAVAPSVLGSRSRHGAVLAGAIASCPSGSSDRIWDIEGGVFVRT
jgi:hypothetical protein